MSKLVSTEKVVITKAGSQVLNHVIKIVSIEKVVITKAGSQVLIVMS